MPRKGTEMEVDQETRLPIEEIFFNMYQMPSQLLLKFMASKSAYDFMWSLCQIRAAANDSASPDEIADHFGETGLGDLVFGMVTTLRNKQRLDDFTVEQILEVGQALHDLAKKSE